TPLASITGPPAGALNQTLTFTLGAYGTGLPASTVFTYNIDWDGDGIVDQTVIDVDGTTVTHAFDAPGPDTIKMTATDPNGHTSAQVTSAINILPVSVSIETDPADATKQALVLDG